MLREDKSLARRDVSKLNQITTKHWTLVHIRQRNLTFYNISIGV